MKKTFSRRCVCVYVPKDYVAFTMAKTHHFCHRAAQFRNGKIGELKIIEPNSVFGRNDDCRRIRIEIPDNGTL
jgi:hypothetical protein